MSGLKASYSKGRGELYRRQWQLEGSEADGRTEGDPVVFERRPPELQVSEDSLNFEDLKAVVSEAHTGTEVQTPVTLQ